MDKWGLQMIDAVTTVSEMAALGYDFALLISSILPHADHALVAGSTSPGTHSPTSCVTAHTCWRPQVRCRTPGHGACHVCPDPATPQAQI
jgi:hypothetical protein